MNRLIPNDETLRRFVPQQVCAVKGEASLFDRIAHWFDTAEQWVFTTFCPETVIAEAITSNPDSPIRNPLTAIAAHQALADAIPSLDLVQTVNGFAVVSNQNLAPASKERVERLIAANKAQRDAAINALLPLLAKIGGWRNTAQCEFFRATLFPTLDSIRLLASGAATWEKFQELRPAIAVAEDRLAAEYISPELMQRLRDETLGIISPLSTIDSRLCTALRGHVADLVLGKQLRETALRDIVDYIRRHPDTFPEWHSSDVAKLYCPPTFKNSIKSHGYWF